MVIGCTLRPIHQFSLLIPDRIGRTNLVEVAFSWSTHVAIIVDGHVMLVGALVFAIVNSNRSAVKSLVAKIRLVVTLIKSDFAH